MGAQHNLSQAQLGDLSSRINTPEIGGFSVRAFGPDAGQPPSHKLMVGMSKYGQRHNNVPVSPETIGNFANERSEALQPEGRYLGGWLNPTPTPSGKRKADLDVSQAYSTVEMDKAMGAAHAGGEEAIGVVGANGAYITDMPTVAPRKLLGWAAGNVTPGLGSPGGQWGSVPRPKT